ncbi:MAG: HAMP domain-containing sensor histidine kinase [Thermotogota bacterium]
MKSFANKISKSLYFNYLIFSTMMVTIIFISTYGIIKQNVQNNLNILFKNKEDFINNYYVDMTDEFFSYMTGENTILEKVDFIYNLDNLTFLESSENQENLKFSHKNLSQDIFKGDSNQLYLINWQYFDTKRYIYGVKLEKLNEIINSESQFGDYIPIIKHKNDYIIPDTVIFKSNLENILSEYPSTLSLDNDSYEISHKNIRGFEFFILYNSNVLNELKNTLVLIGALFLVLGFLISKTNIQYIKSQITTPISSIVTGIKNIKNNKTSEIIYSEDDEFKLIKDEFNSLYKNLSKTINELENSEKNLKRTSEFKSNILKILSHEIRTPMHSIMGFSEILQMKVEDEEDKESLKTIKKSSQEILNKFDRLFERSKIESESDEIKLKLTKFNLLDIVFEESSKYESLCRKKGLKLKLNENNLHDLGDNLLDYKKVKRIFEEVLDNAYKFTDEGEIYINLEDGIDEVAIEIKDTGTGVKTENMDLIYDNFFQTGNYLNRKKDGLGIGLSIVKNYVQMQGGKIYLHPLDDGTSVKITFPKGITKEKIKNMNLKIDLKEILAKKSQQEKSKLLEIINSTFNKIINSTTDQEIYQNIVELQSIFSANELKQSFIVNTEILNTLKDKDFKDIIGLYKEFKNAYETIHYSI